MYVHYIIEKLQTFSIEEGKQIRDYITNNTFCTNITTSIVIKTKLNN